MAGSASLTRTLYEPRSRAAPPLDPALPRSPARRLTAGFTLLELLVVTGIISILASMAIPSFQQALGIARQTRAVQELRALSRDIDAYLIRNGALPDALADVGRASLRDPWGHPYAYLRIDGGKKGNGQVRKDHNLVPLNTDYDLYSMGPDGKSVSPLTAAQSRDDVVRAQNGEFYGPASGY